MNHELAVLSVKIKENRLERIRTETKAMEGDLTRENYETKLAALSTGLADDLVEWLVIEARLISGGNKKEAKRLGKLDKKGIRVFAKRMNASGAVTDAEWDVCRDTLRDPNTHWSVRAAAIKWMGEVSVTERTRPEVIASVAPYAKDDNPLVRRTVEETVSESSEALAAARRERLRAALPPIDEKYLHVDVAALGPRVGPGGERFMEGAEEYKKGHWETACRLMKEAISLELTMPYESAAHRALGTIYIKLGDLEHSVEHYLKCLEVPVRDEEALRDSINVLSLIYRIAGREDDAESLRVLAEKTIGERSRIEPELERQLIELMKAFVG